MKIRPSTQADLPAMEELYARARVFMAENGNPTQWGDTYPLALQMEDVAEDISLGRSYVCEENGQIVAAFMFTAGPDPTYAVIEEGQWPDDQPYGVVHRITTGGAGQGAGRFCLEWCLEQCGNVRIDTHENNRPMRSLLARLGFDYCGIIHVEDGTPRLAYIRKK